MNERLTSCTRSIEESAANIRYQKARAREINEALKRLEPVEEPDDESDDKVLESAGERFEGNRERFE